MDETEKILEEYNIYEKRKIYIDNKTKTGKSIAWVMDKDSVYISEHGEGGPYPIQNINLPQNAKTGTVYEKINGKYKNNFKITQEIAKIGK